MNRKLILAALLCGATPALAQNVNVNDLDSTSTSGAAANSGSLSGAQSNNTANNNQGIGTSENTNTSTSSSGAISGSVSGSQSESNSNGNTQGQDQGQSQGQMQNQDQSSAQANQQGVTLQQTWNTKNRKVTEQKTNNAVPLTSSSSFSSDYCGGTVSGGASAAPLGISIGGSKPVFDKSCQSLRRSEKFGMAAVNAMNMGQRELAGKLMSMMIWSICTSDRDADRARDTANACDKLALLGSDASTTTAQPAPGATPEPRVAAKGRITPEAAATAINSTLAQANTNEMAAASKPPK